MLWGTFGLTHILSLLLAAGIIIGLYFILKGKSPRTQTLVLGVLSFAGIAAIIFNLVAWDSPLEYLPFRLCSLNALVLPYAVFSRSKAANNLLLLWALGAVFALVVNTAQAEYEILSATFAFYYFPHVLELGIPILMFTLGLVKKDPRCIVSTLLITLASYTLIHFINLGVNAYAAANQCLDWAGNVITVNYMYSLQPENPLLDLFWSIIPHPYFYMLLALPVAAVYLLPVYLKDILAAIKARHHR
ncbi:MAG: hypothetical protein E7644_06645 [Ruminococcaceae bacterium]|nr:hypothetical protein [Oscillospiraceae bacterium]